MPQAGQPTTVPYVTDDAWVRDSFFVRKNATDKEFQAVSRTWNEGKVNFYDTTPGGNESINPPPQWSPYTDIREPSLAGGSFKMGRNYNEVFQQNARRITVQMGVAEPNSLSTFFSSFYDPDMASLVRTGEAKPGLFSAYGLGSAIGTLLTLPLQAYFGLNYLYNRVAAFVNNRPYSKFYYMKPTMPLYWNAATTLLNQITNNMGMTYGYTADELTGGSKPEVTAARQSLDFEAVSQLLPDIIRGDSHASIDLYAVASRSQRLADQHHRTLKQIAEGAGDYTDFATRVNTYLAGGVRAAPEANGETLDTLIAKYFTSPQGQEKPVNREISEPSPEAKPTSAVDANGFALPEQTIYTEEPSFMDYFGSELRNGSSFVTFNVHSEDTVTESFSNAVKQPQIAEKFNSFAKSARDLRVNFADGNLGDGPISGIIESVVGGVQSVLQGAMDSVGFAGAAALGGSGFLDIPNVYDTSQVELSRTTYTVHLGSPHGNRMSVVLKQYMPLCLLLAMALPRSSGKNAWNGPFLVRLHQPGRVDTKLGIVDSMVVARGTSNVGWTKSNFPAGITVTFSVLNLNSIMHMPITESLLNDVTGFSFFDEDTALSDYMASLGNLSLRDQFYLGPRVRLALQKTAASWDSFTSPSNMAMNLAQTMPGQILGAFQRYGEI